MSFDDCFLHSLLIHPVFNNDLVFPEPDQTQTQQLEQQRLKEIRDQWTKYFMYPYVLSHGKGSPVSLFPLPLLNLSPRDNSRDITHRVIDGNNNMNIDEGSLSSADNILDSSLAKPSNPLVPFSIPSVTRDGRVTAVRYGNQSPIDSLRRGLRAVAAKNGNIIYDSVICCDTQYLF